MVGAADSPQALLGYLDSPKAPKPPGLDCDLSPNGLDDPNKVVLYLV